MCGSILEAALYELLRRDNGVWAMKQTAHVPKKKEGPPKDINSKDRPLPRYCPSADRSRRSLTSGTVRDTRMKRGLEHRFDALDRV